MRHAGGQDDDVASLDPNGETAFAEQHDLHPAAGAAEAFVFVEWKW